MMDAEPDKQAASCSTSLSSEESIGHQTDNSPNDLLRRQAMKNTEWQEKLSKVAERDWYMLENSILTDCTFSIGEGETATMVKCHQLTLAKTSAYFTAMFYGPMKMNADEVIPLYDVNEEAFRAVLKYMYLGKVDLDEYSYEIVCGILHLVKMYLMPKELKCEIRHYLWQNIYPNNLVTAIEFGQSNDEPKIGRTARQILQGRSKDFDVHGCTSSSNLNLKVGKEHSPNQTSSILANIPRAVKWLTIKKMYGIQIHTQIKKLSPGDSDRYNEKLAIIMKNCYNNKIVAITTCKRRVSYNTTIDVLFDKPIAYYDKTFTLTALFYKTGTYPIFYETRNYNYKKHQNFCNLNDMEFHYFETPTFFNFVAYQ